MVRFRGLGFRKTYDLFVGSPTKSILIRIEGRFKIKQSFDFP